ncbi:unnamed protein product [Toxocara canis]|uniref:3-hydroxyacyl-CoA dehydrogenase type-2 n=1 Tax=Toxocara canis TaxID=6265 RepID=A0A183V3J4_TOXCA|nr:unnamed protein product [Toxocara canis]
MGYINVTAYAAELFAENEKDDMGQRGVIINTASIAAFDGQSGQCAYSASKGAICGMTLPLARDFADDGIRVMTIAPGIFDTPMMAAFPDKVRNFLIALVPNPKRFGIPDEYGALISLNFLSFGCVFGVCCSELRPKREKMSSGTGMSALRSAKGLVTLVTGGASGLGRGTAEHLLKHGAKVAILDLPTSKAAELAKELGADCLFTSANVTAVAEVKAALGEVKKTFGRLDVVVNCAGIAYAFKLYSVKKKVMADLEQVRRTLDVNVMGSFNVIAHAVEMFAENEKDDLGQRGLIINTASIAAFDGQAGQSSYSASKGAIASMTLPLARDFADDGIRVMAIAPGIFDTPIMGSFPPKFLSGLVPHPRRFGMPEEFGALVRHIIENRYLNGEVIRLDGALRMPA